MEGLQWWCIHDLKLSLREGGRRGEDDEGGKGEDRLGRRSHIYCEPGPAGRSERSPFWGESSRSPFWEEGSGSQNRPF
jgi:hypothetical protein